MYNPNAVNNIISEHIDRINRQSNFFKKVALYLAAVVAFVVLNSHGYPVVGWGVMIATALLTLVFLGLPKWLWWDDIQDDLVPDAVYAAIKSSDAIEPGLIKAIQHSLCPELTVRDLVAVVNKYLHDKKITSRPGYSGLALAEPDKPETN